MTPNSGPTSRCPTGWQKIWQPGSTTVFNLLVEEFDT